MEMITEGKQIKMKLKIYGYEKGRVPMTLTREIENIGRILIDLPNNEDVKGFNCSKKEAKDYAESILKDHFALHEIPFLEMRELEKVASKFIDQRGLFIPSYVSQFQEEIKGTLQLVTPYDLPLRYVKGHSMVGEIKKSIAIIPDEEFLTNTPVTFSEIELGDNITKLTPATYIHEITHSQLESIKGATKNYHNKEVLTIFMEKLAALEIDSTQELLKTSELMRFRDLLEKIVVLKYPQDCTRTELLEATVYINSILQAESLFDKFLYGNQETRNKILRNIQDVFDGKQTVEDLLKKEEISLENSTDIRLIKRHL